MFMTLESAALLFVIYVFHVVFFQCFDRRGGHIPHQSETIPMYIRYHLHTLYVCEVVVLKIVQTKGQNEKSGMHDKDAKFSRTHRGSLWPYICRSTSTHWSETFFARHTCETCQCPYERNKSKRPSHWSGRLISRSFYFLDCLASTSHQRASSYQQNGWFPQALWVGDAVCEAMSNKYFQQSGNHRSAY